MTPPPDNSNGSRRAIDSILLARLNAIETKVDALYTLQINTEHRITKLETHATIRGMVGGAISSLVAGVGVALWWILGRG